MQRLVQHGVTKKTHLLPSLVDFTASVAIALEAAKKPFEHASSGWATGSRIVMMVRFQFGETGLKQPL